MRNTPVTSYSKEKALNTQINGGHWHGRESNMRPLYHSTNFYLRPAAPYLALSSRASRALPWTVSRDSREA